MINNYQKIEAGFLGDQSPLKANMARGLPDRRRISKRWFSGLVLAGVTSLYLMGGALYAALDGREKLTLPAQAYEQLQLQEETGDRLVAKGDRPGIEFDSSPADNNVMMVSTITRDGDRNIIKMRPFLHISAPLAIIPKEEYKFPPFNALNIYSEGKGQGKEVTDPGDSIYGEAVESEVAISFVDFDPQAKRIATKNRQKDTEIEQLVRKSAPDIKEAPLNMTSYSYVDPARFSENDTLFVSSPELTIRPENVSVVSKEQYNSHKVSYQEDIKTILAASPFKTFLTNNGLDSVEAGLVSKVLQTDLASDETTIGDKYRLAFRIQTAPDGSISKEIQRISVYRGSTHLVSMARSDEDHFVYSSPPALIPQLLAKGKKPPAIASTNLPSIYEGIYRAALSQGLTENLAKKLVNIMAFNVDFRATATPKDELTAFVSLPDGAETPDETSELLFASITINNKTRRYYRFRDPESGIVDYYDEDGKSSRKFLLRKPVPNARFRSPFGMRRHPISGVRKMHNGVDWSAPRGTPIIAAGDGIVEKAGWAGGYGRQTTIRHANGYKTIYSHQSRIKRGIRPGARVRQGQVIGTVGTTGYSTGPHLHFEVKVNDRFVNPMRIRLPSGKEIKGSNMAAFSQERDRINALLKGKTSQETTLAEGS